MRKLFTTTLAVSLQAVLAIGVSAETIKQRDYAYSYDEEARNLDDDVFVVCTDGCADSQLNQIHSIAARYSIDPEEGRRTTQAVSPVKQEPAVAQEESPVERKILGIIHFPFNSFALSRKSKSQVDNYGLAGKRIKLEGFTCMIGTEKYNLKLSQNRAKAVADYLRKKGISVLCAEGIGKSAKYKEKASNRRVEIITSEKE